MVVDKQKLKEELIQVYEGYSKDINNKDIMKKAQDLFFNYVYNTDSMDRELVLAVQNLEHIGWEYSRSTRNEQKWKLGSEEAAKILEKLKSLG
jgi:hypothetical protein